MIIETFDRNISTELAKTLFKEMNIKDEFVVMNYALFLPTKCFNCELVVKEVRNDEDLGLTWFYCTNGYAVPSIFVKNLYA